MPLLVTLALGTTLLAGPAWGQDVPVPSLTVDNGRHVLLVDGKPFIILGGQVTNSSNYPVALPRVWQVARAMNANTMEMPVAWEQIEPREGQFDFSYVDQLLREAREHGCMVSKKVDGQHVLDRAPFDPSVEEYQIIAPIAGG